jgi:Zn-dependent protease with chaperone function
MVIRSKKILLFSGVASFMYFFTPVLAEIGPFQKVFSWLFNSEFYIISGGIYGGVQMFTTGNVVPCVIQFILFLISWFILYKLIKLAYLAIKEANNKKEGLNK